MNNYKRIPALVAALTLSPTTLLAAEAKLEEVVVTAQKRTQNLQDVPMAITALGREMLQDNEINSVEDLTKLVPSMRFTPGDDPSNNSIRMRGVGTSVFSIAVEPNVSVVVDDVPLARTEMASFEFADLERVEVLRGPQGTLFGKNSTAGLIHVISRDPAPEFEGFARFSGEDRANFPGHLLKAQLGASGPVSDTVGIRLTGFVKQVEGHLIDILQNENLPNNDTFGLRAKLLWEPSDNLVIRLNIEHQETDGESSPFVFRSASDEKREKSQDIPYGEENRTTKTFGNNLADSTNRGVTLKMDWDLGNHTLTSISGWRGYHIDRNIGVPELDGDRIDVTHNGGDRSIRSLTQELRLTSNNSETLEYTLGALWFDSRVENNFYRTIEDIPAEYVLDTVSPVAVSGLANLGLVPGTSLSQYIRTDGVASTQNLGVFAQGTWHITDRWHLTMGARYIVEELIASVEREQYTVIDATGTRILENEVNIPNQSFDDRASTGVVSLQYDWSDAGNVYATVSTGYRGGAFDFANSDLESAFENPVAPETALALELGSKSRFWDDRLQLNVALFHTTFQDFQAQVVEAREQNASNPIPGADFSLANAGELETQGVEIEFQAKPLASLFLSGSLLYNKAVFNEFVGQCFYGQQEGENKGEDLNDDGNCDQQDLAGKTLANAPEWSASLSGRYEKPLSNGSLAFAQLSTRWQDDVQFSNEQHPLTIQEAYAISDIRIGWTNPDGKLNVAGYINNIFAQNYVAHIQGFSTNNNRNDVFHFLPAESDRIFGLSVGYEW